MTKVCKKGRSNKLERKEGERKSSGKGQSITKTSDTGTMSSPGVLKKGGAFV